MISNAPSLGIRRRTLDPKPNESSGGRETDWKALFQSENGELIWNKLFDLVASIRVEAPERDRITQTVFLRLMCQDYGVKFRDGYSDKEILMELTSLILIENAVNE